MTSGYWQSGYAEPGYVIGDEPATNQIASYAGLKSAIAGWLNREDLGTRVDDFIDLAEARFNRELRVNAMIQRASTQATDNYVTLPPDWLQHIAVEVDGLADAATYVTPEEIYDLSADGLTGLPRFYTIINNALRLLPAPSAPLSIEITYYQKIPALSDTQTTNWLLTRSPDLYLFGALLAAEPYLMNDERVALWAAQSTAIIAAMNMESERAKRSSGALRRKVKSFG